jgi:serine/threonine-protein kinase
VKTKPSSAPPPPADPGSVETRIEGVGASRPPSVEPLSAGPRIQYESLIARGGMGAVHRVFDRAIRRVAAMKILDERLALQQHSRRRFLAEAQIAGQLDHPNIVPVYDLDFAEDGTPKQFTMKLVDGVTLTSMLTPERVVARSASELFELLQAFVKVCDAVAFAHSRGVVHRDLKPDNVMLGDYGQVYVMDWGIAKVLHARGGVTVDEDELPDESGSIIGSAQYMAPEQAWGDNDAIDARTDVFALGGLLYQILTGAPPYRAPFPSDTLHMARLGVVTPPQQANPDVPVSPSLSRIAMKALSASPDDRYATVDAMKRDVEGALRGGLWLGSRTFTAGSVILREGDPPDAAYILTSGRAVAYAEVDGERRVLREMGPGEVFGEMALLADRPRTASVAAVDEVTAIVVTAEALSRELHSESWLAALVHTLVARLCDLDARVRKGGG